MPNGKTAQQQIREFVKQERADLLERRNAIMREVQEAFDKEVRRLDELEARLAKEEIALPISSVSDMSTEISDDKT